MEAWKFVDYTSISPVFALSLTTRRWGLATFPANLVGFPGSLSSLNWTATQTAFDLPYGCSDGSSDNSDNIPYYSDLIEDPGIISISASTNFCEKAQPCSDSGCVTLIEGIGKNTTGPANSRIIGLTHGISSLLVAATTALIATMGNSCFKGERQHAIPTHEIKRHYNPPPLERERYAENIPGRTNKAKEIVQCSNLLREMYEIDLKVWGMQSVVAEEATERETLKRKSTALFAEITRIIQSWRTTGPGGWSHEEWEHIEEICTAVELHRSRLY